jgi:hypothetical protein
MEFLEKEILDVEDLDVDFHVMLVRITPPVTVYQFPLISLLQGVPGIADFTQLQEDVSDLQQAVNGHVNDAGSHVNKAGWVNISLENGWTQISGKRIAAYRILATGLIIFKGRITGANSTSGVFATLPVGSRPSYTMDLVAWGDGSPTLININSSGQVSCAVPQYGALSLENIVFSV